eukprot:4208031-Pyramimonas_sp.AAC.1
MLGEDIPQPFKQHVEEAWQARVKTSKEFSKLKNMLRACGDDVANSHLKKLAELEPKIKDPRRRNADFSYVVRVRHAIVHASVVETLCVHA